MISPSEKVREKSGKFWGDGLCREVRCYPVWVNYPVQSRAGVRPLNVYMHEVLSLDFIWYVVKKFAASGEEPYHID